MFVNSSTSWAWEWILEGFLDKGQRLHTSWYHCSHVPFCLQKTNHLTFHCWLAIPNDNNLEGYARMLWEMIDCTQFDIVRNRMNFNLPLSWHGHKESLLKSCTRSHHCPSKSSRRSRKCWLQGVRSRVGRTGRWPQPTLTFGHPRHFHYVRRESISGEMTSCGELGAWRDRHPRPRRFCIISGLGELRLDRARLVIPEINQNRLEMTEDVMGEREMEQFKKVTVHSTSDCFPSQNSRNPTHPWRLDTRGRNRSSVEKEIS